MKAWKHLASGEIAVETWQFTLDFPLPPWIAARGISLAVSSGDTLTALRISANGPPLIFAPVGHWLTLDKFGLVDVWTPAEFAEKFRPVEAEAPKEARDDA